MTQGSRHPGCAEFTINRTISCAAADLWDLVTDWPAHQRWVPATKITVTQSAPAGVGTVFSARTGFGWLGFTDVMRVTHWQPPTPSQPGHCEIEKIGAVVHGGARIEVSPVTAGSSQLSWHEWLKFPVISRLPGANRVITPVAAGAFGRVVAQLAAELQPPR